MENSRRSGPGRASIHLPPGRTVTSRSLLLFLLLLAPGVLTAQAGSPTVAHPGPAAAAPRDVLLAELPASLRSLGERLLAESEVAVREDLVDEMVDLDDAGSVNFLLALLETESAAEVRLAIVDELDETEHPLMLPALERRVAVDPEVDVVLASLDQLRARRIAATARLLDERLARARLEGDAATEARLSQEEERWISLARGSMLPSFMQEPPPVFAVKPASQRLRVLAFGDFGDGSVAQRDVAAAMLRHHRTSPFDFAVTVGDNFYSSGMASPADPRWKSWWSDLYDPLRIEFYATLGNHDWGFPDSPAAEILYSRQSPSWRMPATYYTYTAGPVHFFALDTDALSDRQLEWLRAELERSTARWKVVYGHHPIYSAGDHGDDPEMIARLLPVLRDRADVYLAGHDHDMQHLKSEGSLHFFVAGSGGKLRPIEPNARSIFARSANGFAVLEVDPAELTLRFVDQESREVYRHTIRK